MKKYRADLHIHSCLSPCGELEMSPKAIVEKSIEKGLDIIALCDHNSAENVGATVRAGRKRGLYVFPGMEINSKEEIHTVALFETEDQALALQDLVYISLEGTNRPNLFGEQVRVNEFDEVEGFNDRLLIGSVKMDIYTIVREIHNLGGLSIASHVDRPSFSLQSQLGYLPDDLDFDAIELSRDAAPDFMASNPGFDKEGLGPISSSDAHWLDDIGEVATIFYIEAPELNELKLAFLGAQGRTVEIAD
jgi:PHP family Zn ribbon phosphoesterase